MLGATDSSYPKSRNLKIHPWLTRLKHMECPGNAILDKMQSRTDIAASLKSTANEKGQT